MVLKKCLIFFLAFFLFFLVIPQKTEAVVTCNKTTNPAPPLIGPFPDGKITLTFDKEQIKQELINYSLDQGILTFSYPGGRCAATIIDRYSNANFLQSDPTFEINTDYHYKCGGALGGGKHTVQLLWELPPAPGTVTNIKNVLCTGVYEIQAKPSVSCKTEVIKTSGIGDVDSEWKYIISDIKIQESWVVNVKINGKGGLIGTGREYPLPGNTIEDNIGKLGAGSYQVQVYAISWLGGVNPLYPQTLMCSTSFQVQPKGTPAQPTQIPSPIPQICGQPQCQNGACSGDCSICPGCPGTITIQPNLLPICDQLGSDFKQPCNKCQSDGQHTWTAIGCIPNKFEDVIKDYVLVVGISIAGGTSFLYFLYGAFLILTSAGNAEKIEEAKQIIISALSGLLLIIFSIFLLRVIGVDILKIPGFS